MRADIVTQRPLISSRRIELRHFRYFVAVAEQMSFRRAARRVYIAPAPLSRAIRELEDFLGANLFSRTQHSLHITPAGSRMLEEAYGILANVERAVHAVREADRCSSLRRTEAAR